MKQDRVRTWLISLLLGAPTCILSGCCWGRTAVVDKLETVALIGFGEPPCHPCPGKALALEVKPNEAGEVWLRLVYQNKIHRPVALRELKLRIIDTDGTEIQPGVAEIEPLIVHSSANGFNHEPIRIKIKIPGVYRVRATYADKRAESFSYSPPIIVKSFDDPK
jgi:hypothetical protein